MKNLEINDSLINDELNNSKNDINTKENNDIKKNILIEEDLCEDANICQLLEDKNRLNTWLLDWLLNNEALYKEIIVKLKRIKLKKESDDEELIKNLYMKRLRRKI